MSNYRDKFSKDTNNRVTLSDIAERERKENLFYDKYPSYIMPISTDEMLSEVESERYTRNYIKLKNRYLPDINYADPSTFCFYGIAEKYYEDSITNIHNTYPYDGSSSERIEWSLTASFLDLHILEHELSLIHI